MPHVNESGHCTKCLMHLFDGREKLPCVDDTPPVDSHAVILPPPDHGERRKPQTRSELEEKLWEGSWGQQEQAKRTAGEDVTALESFADPHKP
jgi:hypothetical protein